MTSLAIGPLFAALALALAQAHGADAPGLPPVPGNLAAERVLPPPPSVGSPQATAELAELHAALAKRTAAERAAAKAEGEMHDASVFAEAMGPGFDLGKLPATARLMAALRKTEQAVVEQGKDFYRRPRPWIVDPSITPCSRSEPLSSYPSGHATFAYSFAAVLAQLAPDRSAALFARAARYVESRIACDQHFRSDLTAGQALGMLVAERLRGEPEYRAMFDAAEKELRAAGVTAR